MPEASDDLYMTSLQLDTARLAELGRRRGLPRSTSDDGYLVHCALGELFGDHAPKPFAIQGSRGRWMDVLGYGKAPGETLRGHAERFAAPTLHAACEWNHLAQKRMPGEWPEGTRLGFRVRACPVVRMSSDGPKHRAGAEVDAFLARCWKVGPETSVSREEVYADWLGEQLERRGARLESAAMEGFQRARLVRRTQGSDRKSGFRDRPSALMVGTLQVTDGSAFRQLLARGVGRHRAFGFGMLLLRPAGA